MKQKFICPADHGKDYQFVFAAKDRMFGFPGEFFVVRCTNCCLVSLFPMPTAEELKKYYPSKRYYAYDVTKGKGLFARLRRYLLQHQYQPNLLTILLHLVIPRVPAIPESVPRGKILDIGCGTGETLLLLKELGWETYGMDIDKKAVAVAKNRGVDHVRVGPYQNLAKYPDNFFDAIRLYHVIEHLDDPVKCLRLIRKKLKKGGQLIIGTPNVDSYVAKIFGTYWYNLDSPRHLILFSPKTLDQLVFGAGLRVTGIEFCSAGGLLGSLQYWLESSFNFKINLINNTWLVILFYSIELLLDKVRLGDVFVVRSIKI